MTTPLVSIILPVYNSEKFLEDSLVSIINQTYTNWELLIIYDMSTDKSLDIIKNFIQQDSRIKLIDNPTKGIISALNHGIIKSKGEFIARMDSDDISLPERIYLQIHHMIKEKLDVCGCHSYIINEKGKVKNISYVPLSNINCFIRLFSAVPFAHPSVIMRKEFLIINNISYGMNTKRYAEDLDMWINLYNSGAKFGNINSKQLKYRVVKNSLSRQNKDKLRNESLLLYNSFFEKYLKKVAEMLNQKIELINEVDKYYYSRMVIRYILRKFDLNKTKKLKEIDIKIILKAFLVEFKNHILHIFIRYNKKK